MQAPKALQGLGAAQVLGILDTRRQEAQRPQVSEASLKAYRASAAVLVTVSDPDRLRPMGELTHFGEAPVVLANDLIPSSARKFDGQVMLSPDVRREALKELVAEGNV